MKKLCILLIAAFCSVANAQTEKGKVLIGCSSQIDAVYSHLKTNSSSQDYSIINVSPQIGFFLKNNFMLGGFLNVSLQNTDGFKNQSFAFGPIARVYLGSSNVKFFISGNAGLVSVNTEISNNSSSYTGTMYGAGIGAAFFFNEHVSFDTMIGYSDESLDERNTTSTTIRLGFNIIL